MKKIFTIIACVFFIMKMGLSQQFDDGLYQHLSNFQIINGELKKGDLCTTELKNRFNIQELVPNTNTSVFKITTDRLKF